MNMETKYKYYNRGFLNQDEGMAAFESDVTVEESEGGHGYTSATFSITDCNRKVSLDFVKYGDEHPPGGEFNIEKVDILMKELFEFKQAMILAKESNKKDINV